MKSGIDDIDRKILDCLHIDARMACSEIARRIETLTARAVRNRLDRLLEEGYVEITAAARPARLGYVIQADIAVEVEAGKVTEVSQRLEAIDEIYYVAITTGDTDISTTVVVRNMDELHNFIGQQLPSIPGVRKTTTSVVTKIVKTGCSWSFPSEISRS